MCPDHHPGGGSGGHSEDGVEAARGVADTVVPCTGAGVPSGEVPRRYRGQHSATRAQHTGREHVSRLLVQVSAVVRSVG
ncbi:hypothetical protein B7P34_31285 [Streptosporangium nondiastaticum]|uniref:Uncharacterized protein n=1 Tax=Streptosporangium nondiastaticum TaxID=35764 RepID=A0A9X7JJI7_9ACTN|nr:hypothetical protein B7P34_31285 [Streptosporangium nondiastaticum]